MVWLVAFFVSSVVGCGRDVPVSSALSVIAPDATAVGGDAQVAQAMPTASSIADASAALSAEAGTSATRITDAQLEIDFGPCFGNCPTYTLHLGSDGAFSGPDGKRQIGGDETQAIFALVDGAFADGAGACPGPTDVQYTNLTYRRLKAVHTTRYAAMHPCSSKIVEAVRRANALRGK